MKKKHCITGSPQQPSPIAAYLSDGSGSPHQAPTVSFIKKKTFKCTLKSRDGVCQPNPNWELVPLVGWFRERFNNLSFGQTVVKSIKCYRTSTETNSSASLVGVASKVIIEVYSESLITEKC